MISNTMQTTYKPFEIRSDYSVSYERIEAEKERIKNIQSQGQYRVESYLAPDSYENATSYLGAYVTSGNFKHDTNNPLSFKNDIKAEESLIAKSNMQNFLNTSNPAGISYKNTFGGYSIDENGFMGQDFLKASNLHSDYKIHKNALQAINDYFTTPIAREKDVYYPEFESIDIIAGLSHANGEFNFLFSDNKQHYTKEEIMQKGNGVFDASDFNTPLMQDYMTENGEFKREGILLMYAFKSDAFARAESPHTKLSEYGKFQRGMPSEYSPSGIVESEKEAKSPEEIQKENKDKLMDYYLKAIAKDESEDIHKESKYDSIIRDILKDSKKEEY
ncbi:hypothetical protein [Helicobacter ibis]|uniref:Uncharacterized protein n=1 Tax=Helicobacter ibis TaxID=2962633 RepID=A0ABT4VEU2_9HELI|nr:hypothetical protein [Helicobacter ibis]MDA3969216.1 hypothetical protein [Helicobacter ibis]